MKRILPAILSVWMGGFALFAQSEEPPKQPREAKQEAMPPGRFSKTHAPLFSPPKSNDAGSLTESLVAAGPHGEQPETPAGPSAEPHRPIHFPKDRARRYSPCPALDG